MDNAQKTNMYSDVIRWILDHKANEHQMDKLTTIKTIFDNMGVAFPDGTEYETVRTIETNDYMGWRKCSEKEVQSIADEGTPVIAVEGDQVYIVPPQNCKNLSNDFLLNSTVRDYNSQYSSIVYYSYSRGETSIEAVSIEPGIYYINQRQFGSFLRFSPGDNRPIVSSGKVSNLSSSICWIIQMSDDGHCFIKPLNNSTKYLSVDSSGYAAIISPSASDLSRCKWDFFLASYGCFSIMHFNTGRYLYVEPSRVFLTTTRSLGSKGSSEYENSMWRYAKKEVYDAREMSSYSVNKLQLRITEEKSPLVIKTPRNAMWSNSNDFKYFYKGGLTKNDSIVVPNSSGSGLIGNHSGDVALYAKHKVTGKTSMVEVSVSPLLIYKTLNTELYDNSENTVKHLPEDIKSQDLTEREIVKKVSGISNPDFYKKGQEQYTVIERKRIVLSFFKGQVGESSKYVSVLTDMFNHFLDGKGTDYSNPTITSDVKKHENTKYYIEAFKRVFMDLVRRCNGDIFKLHYDESLCFNYNKRRIHPVVREMNDRINMGNKSLLLPSYPGGNSEPGLALCIDSWHGNSIAIEQFNYASGHCSGSLKIRFYDHFGLDSADLNKERDFNFTASSIGGFKQWYILQHWKNLKCDKKPKPFVTIIEYSEPFDFYI